MAFDDRAVLADRLQRLEDREAIRELRYRYCYAVDSKDWGAFLDLFAEDARVEFADSESPEPAYQGQDELEEFCAAIDSGRIFMAHMVHNPVLSVDGDTAEGTWYFEVPEVVADGSAVWVQGRYDESYRRDDGNWKFGRIELDMNYSVPYQEGWAEAITDENG